MHGSSNINRTGQHVPNCSPRRTRTKKPTTHTKSQLVSSATRPSAASCNSVSRRWHRDLSRGSARPLRAVDGVMPSSIAGFLPFGGRLTARIYSDDTSQVRGQRIDLLSWQRCAIGAAHLVDRLLPLRLSPCGLTQHHVGGVAYQT